MVGTAVGLVILRRLMGTVGIMAGDRMDMVGIAMGTDGITMVMAGIMVGTGVIIITTITATIEGIEIETGIGIGIEELYQVAITQEVTV